MGLSVMRIHLTLALLLAWAAAPAGAEIWECIDESGNKRFTNIQADSKGCRLLSIAAPNTVPALKAKTGEPAKPATTPKDFPRVDTDTQRQRDNDRRKILEQEMANEQRLLDQARRELSEQESIRLGSERNYQRVLDRLEPYRKKVKLHEDNVANLRRELGNMK
jgi:hypothetical protein